MSSGANESPSLTRWPLANVIPTRAIGSAPGLELLNIRRYCSSSQRNISCSSRDKALDVFPALAVRDLCLREMLAEEPRGRRKVASGSCCFCSTCLGVVWAASWLMDTALLFVLSYGTSSFAMGWRSFDDGSAGGCRLAAVAAVIGCVGGKRFPPPLGCSLSSVLCSRSAEEFVVMSLLF